MAWRRAKRSIPPILASRYYSLPWTGLLLPGRSLLSGPDFGVGIPLAFEDSQMTRPVIDVVTPRAGIKKRKDWESWLTSFFGQEHNEPPQEAVNAPPIIIPGPE